MEKIITWLVIVASVLITVTAVFKLIPKTTPPVVLSEPAILPTPTSTLIPTSTDVLSPNPVITTRRVAPVRTGEIEDDEADELLDK